MTKCRTVNRHLYKNPNWATVLIYNLGAPKISQSFLEVEKEIVLKERGFNCDLTVFLSIVTVWLNFLYNESNC